MLPPKIPLPGGEGVVVVELPDFLGVPHLDEPFPEEVEPQLLVLWGGVLGQGVVHVEAIVLYFLQMQAAVHEHSAKKENNPQWGVPKDENLNQPREI